MILHTHLEDFTLVLKLQVTVNMKDNFQPGGLGIALASHMRAPGGDELRVWPFWAQNIITVATQDCNVANALVCDFTLGCCTHGGARQNQRGGLPRRDHGDQGDL